MQSRSLSNTRDGGQCDIHLSVPSISSINRILRTGSEHRSPIDWSPRSQSDQMSAHFTQTQANSQVNFVRTSNSSNDLMERSYNDFEKNKSDDRKPKKRRKYSSYNIEEILRADSDSEEKDWQSEKFVKEKQASTLTGSSDYLCSPKIVINSAPPLDTINRSFDASNNYYSYCYQAIIAAQQN